MSYSRGSKLIISLIVILGVAAYAVRYFQQRASVQPFTSHIEEYLALSNLHEFQGAAYIIGKVVTIDREVQTMDDTFFELPGELKAQDPRDVGTVVWVKCREWSAASYTDGRSGFQTICDATVIDVAATRVVARQRFYGSFPPPSKAGAGDWHGDRPSEAIVAYLSQLPRYSTSPVQPTVLPTSTPLPTAIAEPTTAAISTSAGVTTAVALPTAAAPTVSVREPTVLSVPTAAALPTAGAIPTAGP